MAALGWSDPLVPAIQPGGLRIQLEGIWFRQIDAYVLIKFCSYLQEIIKPKATPIPDYLHIWASF